MKVQQTLFNKLQISGERSNHPKLKIQLKPHAAIKEDTEIKKGESIVGPLDIDKVSRNSRRGVS